jgi:hypothetical protein
MFVMPLNTTFDPQKEKACPKKLLARSVRAFHNQKVFPLRPRLECQASHLKGSFEIALCVVGQGRFPKQPPTSFSRVEVSSK